MALKYSILNNTDYLLRVGQLAIVLRSIHVKNIRFEGKEVHNHCLIDYEGIGSNLKQVTGSIEEERIFPIETQNWTY